MSGSPEPEGRSGTPAGGPEGDVEVRTPAPRPRKMQPTAKYGGPGSSTPARRKKRSKRREERQLPDAQPQTVITDVLKDLQDDIVEGPAEVTTDPAGVSFPGTVVPLPGHSGSNKVYVQHEHGFSQTTRDKVLRPGISSEDGDGEKAATTATPLGTAIAIQERLLPFYTLCHGLLGGWSLATFIMSYSSGSSSAGETASFVMTLSPFIHAAGTVFYFLCAICTVSVFDRFDLSNMDFAHVADTVRYQGMGLVIVAVYLFTLTSTLVCSRWDDGIALYFHNSSHWSSQQLSEELGTWRALNACRCIGGMLGWLLVSVTPARDMLRDHLAAMLQYQSAPAVSGTIPG